MPGAEWPPPPVRCGSGMPGKCRRRGNRLRIGWATRPEATEKLVYATMFTLRRQGPKMIRLIEALNYRCLRYIRQPLDAFHVLVGPNASGKSTFLDVPNFIYTMFQFGLDKAIKDRTDNILDLLWRSSDNDTGDAPALRRFELAIELALPDQRAVRYCVAVGLDQHDAVGVLREEVRILQSLPGTTDVAVPASIFRAEGELIFPDAHLQLSPDHRARPDTFFRQLMGIPFLPSTVNYIRPIMEAFISLVYLEAAELRKASPPGEGMGTRWSGAGLPNMVEHLRKFGGGKWPYWQAHLRTVFPGLDSVQVHMRPEDRKRYVALRMKDGAEFPSWLLSDGTLHLLALTILAYLPPRPGISSFMVEEPESHLHPLNIEAVMQALSSVYDGQVLLTTHSPAVLALTDPGRVLVFSRDVQQGVAIVRGNQHARLRDWKGEVDLGTLFAGGVLG